MLRRRDLQHLGWQEQKLLVTGELGPPGRVLPRPLWPASVDVEAATAHVQLHRKASDPDRAHWLQASRDLADVLSCVGATHPEGLRGALGVRFGVCPAPTSMSTTRHVEQSWSGTGCRRSELRSTSRSGAWPLSPWTWTPLAACGGRAGTAIWTRCGRAVPVDPHRHLGVGGVPPQRRQSGLRQRR